MKIVIWIFGLVVLAIAGAYLAGVAARERSQAGRTELMSGASFRGLEVCSEIPGLRERVIGRGDHTTAYASEFTSVASVPWVTGTSKIFMYVLAGRGTVLIGNAELPARPGDFFQLPPGVRHAVVVHDGTLRAVYVEDEVSAHEDESRT